MAAAPGTASLLSPTYFLPPNFTSFPASAPGAPSPICLGQLICQITNPSETIDTLPPVDLAEFGVKVDVVASDARGHSINNITSMYPSLFHKAVQVVGVSQGAKIEKLSYENVVSDFTEFEINTIDPSGDYVQASLQQESVQAWVKDTFFSKGLYMVTGILIAKPRAEVDGSNGSTSDGETSDDSTDSSGNGAPLTEKNTRETLAKILPTIPFLYGFRLRQCFFRRGRAGSVVHARDAKVHADSADKVLAVKESGSIFSYSGIGNLDLNVEQLGSEAEGLYETKVWDDATGEECSVVLATWKSQE